MSPLVYMKQVNVHKLDHVQSQKSVIRYRDEGMCSSVAVLVSIIRSHFS